MGWWRSAACSDEDPELFFPVGASGPGAAQEERAKAVCERCPVEEQCLQWALDSGQNPGIWGGTTEDDRRAIRRRRALRRSHSPSSPSSPRRDRRPAVR
ncbi:MULTISPECIES: WhiB family transcriptional regulator [unclassified Streptomyces]|uniref:WhiB family transcriptional regulator n=1 Tax=unclassified Streptomyces TaxID=2593676 RepID=UPI00380C63CC